MKWQRYLVGVFVTCLLGWVLLREGPVGSGAAGALAERDAYDVAVADAYDGLRIVSIADPALPAQVGSYDTPGYADDVAVAGSYAYVADGEAGLRVLRVNDPAAPAEVGFFDTPGLAFGVATSGSYSYVADVEAGLRVIEVSNVGLYDAPGGQDGTGLGVSGGYVLLAFADKGLYGFTTYDETWGTARTLYLPAILESYRR